MEQFRLIIVMVLCLGIFLAWSHFFGPKEAQQPPQDNTVQEQTQPKPPALQSESKTVPTQTEAVSPVVESAGELRPARTVVVDSPLYQVTLSEKGASVISVILKKYKETMDKDSPLKEIIDPQLPGAAVFASVIAGGQDIANAVFSLNTEAQEIVVSDQPVELVFSSSSASGVRIQKRYRFLPDTYLIDMDMAIDNAQAQPFTGILALGLRNIFDQKKRTFGFLGPCGLIDNSLEQVALKKIEDTSPQEGNIRWIALEKPYFMTSIISPESLPGKMVVSAKDTLIENKLVYDTSALPPGGHQDFQFQLFLGPKSWSLLRHYNNELDRAIDFGWVDVLAKPCLWFMNFIYRFIPNYGVAIIILTILTRLIFWPLARKSYKSMSEMRKLAPLMKEIREKYKDDKARINQETMALYRTYKINPVSGCLPMLIQLPIFFALYRMLYQAIELRHAPFFGWIQDLSAPDRLFSFGFKIPFMEPPYGIPVLTIIMGITMILQQKMTPTPGGDPTQAKMMMLMPVVFMVIFINFSSGLVLYWLVSNLVAISQQYFTQRQLT